MKREKDFQTKQKRILDALFERKPNFQGLTHVVEQGEEKKEVTTNQPAVLRKVKRHFEAWFKNPKTIATKIKQKLENNPMWKKIYDPSLLNIDAAIYKGLMDPVNNEELINTLSLLPKKKASGLSGVPNEFFTNTGPKFRSILLQLINLCLQFNDIPNQWKKAQIFTIPKSQLWDGDLNQLRPITLLECGRKLLTKILTNRLSTILESNSVLQSNNYGFRAGRSTNDALLILKNCIDIANQKKHPLYIACLDIKRAYDSISFESLEISLRRLRIPERFILFLRNIDIARTLVIITAYGLTDEFHPERGLPQGETLAPLLWTIFYDALMYYLNHNNTGYTIPNSDVKVPTFAFADDITPMSDSTADLQVQLDCIVSFLALHDIKVSAPKSIFLCTLPESEMVNVPNVFLGSDAITNRRHNQIPTRILGVFWTMDGKTTSTFNLLCAQLEQAVAIMQKKHCPKHMTKYIINSVLQAQAAYRLQLTPLTVAQYDQINKIWRGLAKSKFTLPSCFPTEFVTNQFLVGINDFQEIHEKLILKNLYRALRDWDWPGITTRLHLDLFKRNDCSPYKAPYPITAKRDSIATFWINLLNEYQIQIKSTEDVNSTLLAIHLPQSLYSAISESLHTLKIMTLHDIVSHDKKNMRPLYSLLKNKSHDKKFISHLLQLKQEICERQPILQNSSIDRSLTALTALKPKYNIFKTSLNTPNVLPVPLPSDVIINGTLPIYTDGSLDQNGNQGSGIIINLPNGEKDIYSLKHYGRKSSTNAELFAIAAALLIVPLNQPVEILTDSQCSLDGINFITSTKCTDSRLIKRPSLHALDVIQLTLNHRQAATKFTKVKAHVGIVGNEQADQAAKSALSLTTSTTLPHTSQLYFYSHDQIIDMPITEWIKKKYRLEKLKSFDEKLNHQFTDVAIHPQLTSQLYKTLSSKPYFSFFLKNIANLLPTRERAARWDNEDETNHSTCLLCFSAKETDFHIWNCPHVPHQEVISVCTSRFLKICKIKYKTLQIDASFIMDFFLNSCEPYRSQGLITKEMVHHFSSLPTIHGLDVTRLKLFNTNLLLDCCVVFNTSFHDVAWKNRNHRTHNVPKATPEFL